MVDAGTDAIIPRGNTIVKQEPCPGVLVTSILPPWWTTICSTSDRPMPVPTSPEVSALRCPVELLEDVLQFLGIHADAFVPHRQAQAGGVPAAPPPAR